MSIKKKLLLIPIIIFGVLLFWLSVAASLWVTEESPFSEYGYLGKSLNVVFFLLGNIGIAASLVLTPLLSIQVGTRQ